MTAKMTERTGYAYRAANTEDRLPEIFQEGVRVREVEITVNEILRAGREADLAVDELLYAMELCREVLLSKTPIAEITISTQMNGRNLLWCEEGSQSGRREEFPEDISEEILAEVDRLYLQNLPLCEVSEHLEKEGVFVSRRALGRHYLKRRKALFEQFF